MRRRIFDRLFPTLQSMNFAVGPMTAADHLARLTGMDLAIINRDGAALAKGLTKAYELYQPDFLIAFIDVYVEPEAMGVELQYFPNINPNPLSHPAADFIKPYQPETAGRIPALLKAAEICRSELRDSCTIFVSMKDPFSLAAMTIGNGDFLTELVLNPQKSLRTLEICAESQLRLLDLIITKGFIPFIGAPLASGSLIGPEHFMNFAFRPLKTLFNRCREREVPACLHICGEIGSLIEPLSKLQPDMLSIEDFPNGLADGLPQTVFMGYIDTGLFLRGNDESMRIAVSECCNTMPEPFILSSGCDIPAKVKPELVQSFMRYGRRG